MQVAFFLDTFPTLSETFIRNQITGLIDLGHEVTIFCHPNPDDEAWKIEDVKKYKLKDYVVDRRLAITKNKTSRVLNAIKLIKQHWTNNSKQILESLNFFKYGKKAIDLTHLFTIAPFLGHSFDILQCHFGHIANQAIILKKLKFDFRFQVMFHGFDIRLGIKKGGCIYKELIQHVDIVQAISQYNKRNLLNFGFPENKIIFHPVGIDLSKFTKKPNYKPNETIQIVSVGRLVWEKGYKYGLEAIAKLIKEQKFNINYTIIGSGPFLEELVSLSQELQIEKHVNFLGAKNQQEIIKQLHQADLFFLPSEAEALPVVLMEALACGLPALATNVGSVKELVLERENGFIAKPKDVQSLTDKLKQLIDKKDEWIHMGHWGHQHITANYNISVLNKRLVQK
jgi:colanic acid/amylovoran biosynthesis glycosyltransferase